MEVACLTYDFDSLQKWIAKDYKEVAEFAGKEGLEVVIDYVLQQCPQAEKDVYHAVCRGNKLSLVQKFFKVDDAWGIYNACRYDSLEVFKWLESQNVYYDKHIAFNIACGQKSVRIIAYFVYEQNFKNIDALFKLAVSTNNEEYIKMCMENNYEMKMEDFKNMCNHNQIAFLDKYAQKFISSLSHEDPQCEKEVNSVITSAFHEQRWQLVHWIANKFDFASIHCSFPKHTDSVMVCLHAKFPLRCFRRMENFADFRVFTKKQHQNVTQSLVGIFTKPLRDIILLYLAGIH